MRKRLFDGLDQGLGEEILLLENLPPPDGRGACCSLYWALERVLRLTGQDVTYARLMGLAGTAFMVPLGPGLTADWEQGGALRYMPDVFDALDPWAAHEEQPWEPVPLSLCREELLAQRPLAAQDADGTWLAIVGVKGQELLVQTPGSEQPYQRHSLQVKALISLGDLEPDPPQLEAGVDALRRASALLDESQEQWLTWRRALGMDDPYGPEPGQLERFLGEQHLVACVIEARDCAAQFLADMAGQTDFELAEALQAAAQAAEEVVTLLEQLIVSVEVLQVARVLEDGAWLDRRRDVLEEVGRRDERLNAAIVAALDYAGELG
jgi:hypothetical protein